MNKTQPKITSIQETILKVIKKFQPCTIAQIVDISGIARSTVFDNVDTLKRKRFITRNKFTKEFIIKI